MPETKEELMPRLGMCKICLVRKAGALEHNKIGQPVHITEICTNCYTIVYLIKDREMLDRLNKYLVGKV